MKSIRIKDITENEDQNDEDMNQDRDDMEMSSEVEEE